MNIIIILAAVYVTLLVTGTIKYKKVHIPDYNDYLVDSNEVVNWDILWNEIEEEINHVRLTK